MEMATTRKKKEFSSDKMEKARNFRHLLVTKRQQLGRKNGKT